MILVVNDDHAGLYSKFMQNLGETTTEVELLFKRPEEVSLLVFTGGADVSPELYGHKNLGSYNNKARDEQEVMIFEQAHKHEIPMFGVCRGSQFLNVMHGGSLIQDMKVGHGGAHHTCFAIGGEFEVASDHHQMSVLGKEGVGLSWSTESISIDDCVYDGDLQEFTEDQIQWDYDDYQDLYVMEAFAYPKHYTFSVQHHPEWQNVSAEAAQWTLQKTREICLSKWEMTARA